MITLLTIISLCALLPSDSKLKQKQWKECVELCPILNAGFSFWGIKHNTMSRFVKILFTCCNKEMSKNTCKDSGHFLYSAEKPPCHIMGYIKPNLILFILGLPVSYGDVAWSGVCWATFCLLWSTFFSRNTFTPDLKLQIVIVLH